MQQPNIHLAYSPRGSGLRCAIAYVRTRRDVYGWLTGTSGQGHIASYFLLDDFEHPSETRFLAADDPLAGLTREYAPRALELDPPASIDEAQAHELLRLRALLEGEWLCYRSDPAARDEFAQYERAELAAGAVALRFHLLNRLTRGSPTWTFYSKGCEASVVGYVLRHGPLDFHEGS